jgi:hypothetical protein
VCEWQVEDWWGQVRIQDAESRHESVPGVSQKEERQKVNLGIAKTLFLLYNICMVIVENDGTGYRILLYRDDPVGPTVYRLGHGEAYELMLKLAERVADKVIPLASLNWQDKNG